MNIFFKIFFLVSCIVFVSCRDKNDFAKINVDANNLAYPLVKENLEGRVPNTSGLYPILVIENSNFDFGAINPDVKVEHIFKFWNTGNADLTVFNVQPSCGFTVPDGTKTPVKPGGSGEIKIIFNTAGKSGKQAKTVTITSNTADEMSMINFTANVISKTK
jgi:hypothetical protein